MNIEDQVVDLLKKNLLTITTAESCTGGLLAGRLVNVSGVSGVFHQGFITYADKAKRKLLGVSKKTLKKHGAVSKKTAKQMARGAAKVSGAEVSLVTTGIAGPDGGSPEKPVGLVFIGCCVDGDVTVREYHFSGTRKKIRDSAVTAALELACECIQNKFGE